MRNRFKPDLNTIQKQLLDEIAAEYANAGSINKTAKSLGLSNMKVRKALITAGEYSSDISEEIARELEDGVPVDEIAVRMGLTVSAVYSYIPYKVTAYNLPDRSVNADKAARYRVRKKALYALKAAAASGSDWQDPLWDCIIQYQNQRFRTSGRGERHIGAVGFTYVLKVSGRTGEATEELIFSTRELGKTVTRSSVEMAFEKAMEIQEKEGCVSGPKKLGGFGSRYLYAMFLKWELITDGKS